MMSPKNVCIGGYIFGDIIIMGVYGKSFGKSWLLQNVGGEKNWEI